VRTGSRCRLRCDRVPIWVGAGTLADKLGSNDSRASASCRWPAHDFAKALGMLAIGVAIAMSIAIQPEADLHNTILQFWFHEISPAQRWKADPAFDRVIVERFSEIHAQANRCELFEWRKEPKGRLAEIIVLDQFSRNMYRGSRPGARARGAKFFVHAVHAQ
jgi:Bacterial protein of unknown function (DUF924)